MTRPNPNISRADVFISRVTGPRLKGPIEIALANQLRHCACARIDHMQAAGRQHKQSSAVVGDGQSPGQVQRRRRQQLMFAPIQIKDVNAILTADVQPTHITIGIGIGSRRE
jgi:hypothetical protein